jgi:hypothetical protein
MNWVRRLKASFGRGDAEAAQNSVAADIAAGIRPDPMSLSEATGVGEKTIQHMVRSAITDRIVAQVADGIAIWKIDTDAIHAEATGLGLDSASALQSIEAALSDHFSALVAGILADGMVDPAEDRRISEFMEMVGSASLGSETAALIENGRQLYRAASEPLHPIEAPILLKRGEYCVHVVEAEALEERSRTVRINHHGPRARVRIMKGVHYTFGSTALSAQTENYHHSFGRGALCMTNSRLLWISPQKSISVALSNVVRYDPYRDGFRVMKGTGKPLLFLWGKDDQIATIMATRTVEELRS